MQSFLNVAVWVWLAEIFPLHMRGLGIGIAVIFGWATTGFLRFFPALVEAIHINGVFFRFSPVDSAAPRSVPGRPFQV
jgi:MFS transporter, SP family, major inositol transporter